MKPVSAGTYEHDLFQLMLENTQEIFIVIDTSWNIILFNNVAQEVVTRFMNKPFIVGTPVLSYATSDQQQTISEIYSQVFAGNEIKFKYHLPADTTYLVTYKPVKNNEDTIIAATISCSDISSEEKILKRVSISEQLMQRAEGIAGIASWEWDIPSDTINWSQEFYNMLEIDPDIKPSKEVGFNAIHPDDREKAEIILTDTFKSGKPYNAEVRFCRKDGSVKYIYCQGIVLRNEQNRNHKVVGTFLDITKKKQLEESLVKHEQRFQSLVEHSSDLIMQVDKDRIITYASPGLTAMMQYEPHEVVGLRLRTLACEEDFGKMMPAFEKMLAQPGIPVTLEYRVIKKDGTFLWVEGTITNLLHIPGVNSIVLNQRDISQRKEAERLLHQLNQSLEDRASELSSSNVELERFAYIASHDLQEPLRMITGFLKLLQKKYDKQFDEQAQEYINYVVDGAERMKQLINDLLEYSRSGSKRGKLSVINMNELVKEVTMVFKEELDAIDGRIEIASLPEITCERTQIVQLIQNLLANAIKYRSEAPLRIEVRGAQHTSHWEFSVKDNGIGIDPSHHDEVFNIFQRLHARNEYEGTGIGLAICKKIVDANGGTIWIESEAGRGSTFHFTIKNVAS